MIVITQHDMEKEALKALGLDSPPKTYSTYYSRALIRSEFRAHEKFIGEDSEFTWPKLCRVGDLPFSIPDIYLQYPQWSLIFFKKELRAAAIHTAEGLEIRSIEEWEAVQA